MSSETSLVSIPINVTSTYVPIYQLLSSWWRYCSTISRGNPYSWNTIRKSKKSHKTSYVQIKWEPARSTFMTLQYSVVINLAYMEKIFITARWMTRWPLNDRITKAWQLNYMRVRVHWQNPSIAQFIYRSLLKPRRGLISSPSRKILINKWRHFCC